MTPSDLALIIQGIQAALVAAPAVIAIAERGKDFIRSLFDAGLITIDQQNAVFAHVDAICDAALNSEELPHWTVEPDPV